MRQFIVMRAGVPHATVKDCGLGQPLSLWEPPFFLLQNQGLRAPGFCESAVSKEREKHGEVVSAAGRVLRVVTATRS